MKPNPTQPNHIYLIYVYKEDLAVNNLQHSVCHKTQPNQTINSSQHCVKNDFYPRVED